MKTQRALNIVSEFKGESLRTKLNEVKGNLIGKKLNGLINFNDVHEAAIEVKRVSAQIDEIVHATGIIKCLPFIIAKGEVIENLSLAAGAVGEGFDLVTNKRIAEFKFSRWQTDAANGMRKRQVFADFVNLLIYETDKKKELYVFGAEKIKEYFQSNRSSWRNVLSKSGRLDKKLNDFMLKRSIKGEYLSDVFNIEPIAIIDIENILK